MSDLRLLWEPRGVAVVGASAREGSMGLAPVRYLQQHGYGGQVYPINPQYPEVLGYRCYPRVQDCPGAVDLALVMVGADRVPAALADCAAAGVSYAVVLASGFAETGAEGARRQEELLAVSARSGMRLIGPNCIGLVNPHIGLVAGFSPLFARAEFRPGEIGLITQSGALGYGIVSLALERGLHFSRVLNTGNELAFTTREAVADLLCDDVTRVVCVYSEGLQDAAAWPALARLAARQGKPIVMLKAGRSAAGARAALSHTASLAGDDAVLDAVLQQCGVFRAGDVVDLLDLACAFRQPRRPAGNRVGVLTTSGGAGIMAADASAEAGLTLPELAPETRAVLAQHVPAFGSLANPVDVTAQVIADRQVFHTCLAAMAADPNLDALVCAFCVLTGAAAGAVVDAILHVHAQTDKPILVSRTGADALAPDARSRLLAAGIPLFTSPAVAVQCAGALRRFRSVCAAVAQAPAPPPAVPLTAADFPPPGTALVEREAKALLARCGLPVTREALAATPEAAVAAAEAMGYPVVLKVESPDILHKTESGGILLGLRDAGDVCQAFAQIMATVGQRRPNARISGVLVQEQVPAGVEMLIGLAPSPFGPLLTVGAGGELVELWQDSARRLAPVTRAEAETMLASLKSSRLLHGFRGRPPADWDALVETVLQVSALAAAAPVPLELDLNPVLVLPRGQGVRIVDALLATTAGGAPHGTAR